MAFSTLLSTFFFFQLLASSFQPSAVYAQATSHETAAPSTELSVPGGEHAAPRPGVAVSEVVAPEAETGVPDPDVAVPEPEPVVPSAESRLPDPELIRSDAESMAPSVELPVSNPDTEGTVPEVETGVPDTDVAVPEPEPVVPSAESPIANPESIHPKAESSVPSGEPSAPGPEFAAPNVEGPAPSLEPVVPSSEPAVPNLESTVPSPEPAAPGAEAVAPSVESGVPSSVPTVSGPEPGAQIGEPAVPTPEPAIPTAQAVAPSAGPSVASPQPSALRLATPESKPESQIKIGRLSFGFVTSFYQPDLSTLNSILTNRKVAILADPNYLLPGNPAFRVESRNIPVEDLGANPWVGMEAKWEFSPSFALAFSGGVWRAESLATDTIVTFLRSNLPQIEVPRSARYNLLLDQFSLDWRYYFLNDPRHGRISLDLGILGVTLGYFTLDSVMKVVHPAAPRGGFAAVSSTEARGVSFIGKYGLTGEYFLSNKLAFGFSGHYLVGRMTEFKINRHFPAGFPQIPIPEPLSIRAGVPLPTSPPTPNEGDTLRYATTTTDQRGVENVGPQQNLILELDGPEISGYVRFYF